MLVGSCEWVFQIFVLKNFFEGAGVIGKRQGQRLITFVGAFFGFNGCCPLLTPERGVFLRKWRQLDASCRDGLALANMDNNRMEGQNAVS